MGKSTNSRKSLLRLLGFAILVAVPSAICAGIPSFIVGGVFGYLQESNSNGDYDVSRVERIIAEHPDEFGSLRINRGPTDKFLVEGAVESQADLDLLRDELVRTFGEERTEQVLFVSVESGGA